MEPQPTVSAPAPVPSPAPVPAHAPSPKPADGRSGGIMGELFEFVWEVLRVVLISLVIILPVRYFVVQPFFVKGSSMVPNFHDKEYILVDKWSYRLGRPERGDVIVFKAPNRNEYYIKRIIGLPGESVLVENNTVTIFNERHPDGYVLDERVYLPKENPTFCVGNDPRFCGAKVTLDAEHYFVLGDNREHSSDGRSFGPITRASFAGLAWLRLWPLDEIKSVPRTTYPDVVR
jgi:signal peptidase I